MVQALCMYEHFIFVMISQVAKQKGNYNQLTNLMYKHFCPDCLYIILFCTQQGKPRNDRKKAILT